MTENELGTHVVMLVATPEASENLSLLLGSFPGDFAAPIIVALDPDTQTDHLLELLEQRSSLPITVVEDSQELTDETVHVVSSSAGITFSGRTLTATGGSTGSESIQRLLTLATAAFGEELIVVLFPDSQPASGDWARTVHVGGGTVIVQQSAEHRVEEPPLHAFPAAIDIVASRERIVPIIESLLQSAMVSDGPAEELQLERLIEQLRERSGIDFSAYKQPTITRRLQQRLVATENATITEYRRYLRNDEAEYQRLINSLLIKSTQFIRDSDLFDYLREIVLPEILHDRKRHEVRVWSAGCATGEEAYSLAMMLAEILGDELPHVNVRIFATDLDAEAIAFARRGLYPATSLQDVPQVYVERYFTKIGSSYEVKKYIRGLIVFGQHDLGQRASFPRIDLVLCRNVLIYFTNELQRRVLQLFAFALRPQGFLVVGKADSVNSLAGFFETQDSRLKVYRRVGDRVLIPPARIRETAPTVMARSEPRSASLPTETTARLHRGVERSSLGSSKTDSVLLALPVGVVLVDRRYTIKSINAAARRFLGIHTSAIGEDLIHLAQSVPHGSLRAGIEAASQGTPTVQELELNADGTTYGEPTYLRASYSPERAEPGSSGPGGVIIVFSDETESIGSLRALERDTKRHPQEIQQLETQLARFATANQQLVEANQELTMVNADLRIGNDDLIIANEEIQVAAEEVETLNEELQATNEELETVNEELQATIEELNTTTDDLQARSTELHEIAMSHDARRRTSELERARLEAILSGIGDAVLVIDRDQQILLSNPVAGSSFATSAESFIALDEHGTPLPLEQSPKVRLSRGESFASEFWATVQDGSLRHFEAIGRPVLDATDKKFGVLIIRDVTDSKHPVRDTND